MIFIHRLWSKNYLFEIGLDTNLVPNVFGHELTSAYGQFILGVTWFSLPSTHPTSCFLSCFSLGEKRGRSRRSSRSESLSLSTILIMVYMLQVAYLLWTWCPHLSNGGINKLHLVESLWRSNATMYVKTHFSAWKLWKYRHTSFYCASLSYTS